MTESLIKNIELADPKTGDRLALTLRSFRDDEDYNACVALERRTWGDAFAELVPPSILMISQKVGGISAGAFDADGALLAMVYGLTGIRAGKPFHWSHMLAVDPRARGLGLGREMKLYQRDCLLAIGVDCMEWTFDPLEVVNATLNIKRLGAIPIDYALDVYGSGDTSGLHSGIGTDRFIVRWNLEAPHDAGAAAARFDDSVPVVDTDREGLPRQGEFSLPDADKIRIEVPRNIQVAKNEAPGMGRRWRMATRRCFRHYMGSGWRVTCLTRDHNDRCYYGLERGGTV